MRKILGIAAVLLPVSFGALAADVVEAPEEAVIEAPAEVAPERFGWTGIYVGASGGHGWLSDKDNGPLLPLLPLGFEDKGNDWAYGAHAGFLYQFNNGFVAGAELEHLQLGIKFENLGKLFDALGMPDANVTAESATTLRLRGGFAYDRVLFTGHVGGGYVKTSLPAGLGVPTELADWGINAGVGVDYALTDNITAGMQYSHYKFEEFDGTKIDAKVDTLTARVGYKF